MATILSLALKVNADASGVVKNLTPAERALENLRGKAEKAGKVFDEFAGTSAAAANAQFNASRSMAELADSLKRGEITAQEFASRYADLSDAITKETAALKRAAQITEANISPAEKYSRTVEELDNQVRAGRISQETYNRALEKAKTDLDGVGKSTKKTEAELSGLQKILKNIRDIEVFKLVASGISAIGSAASGVASNVTSLVSSVNTSVDTLNDFSARTGIGVEALQGYSFAAKLAGVDTEQFGATVQKLAVSIGKATPGDALDKSLRGINLSVAELRALSPEDQFSAIGNAISELPTAADRAGAAVEIFGQQGAALAPLFREGAASLEELKARAEGLGIIVSETQVNNVADMNDAFDLVRATIEGIVGQVIGNLAPAVTDVTNQFLQFVESWSGAQGEGGTGIANVITDVLLQGAEYFAAVFDEFVSGLVGLGVTFEDTSSTFTASANAFTFVSEGLRTVANVFELAGNALSAALGKIIETLGSFVSSDLEEYGKELTRQAMIATEQNSRQLEDAAANAGRAFVGIFTADGGTAENSGKAAAESYLSRLRDEIRRQRSPEVKVELNLGKTEERLQQFLATAGDEASVFLQQSMGTVETFQQMAEAGGLTADQIKIMNGFMKNVNAELDKELANRKNAADEATKQAEADRKRVDALLASSDASQKLRDDLEAVAAEQGRVLQTLADPKTADAQLEEAAARLAQLDDLQASLEEKLQASSQGFSEGFDKAFESTTNGLTSLIVKAEEFGPAGAAAAEELRSGIERAQNQAAGGIITKEVYDLEVERQKQLFNDRLKQEEEAAKARLKQEEEVDKTLFAAAYGYNSERIKAAETYALLVDEMLVTEEAIAAARANGNQEELAALSQRLQALDQAAAREDDIASGQAKAREEEEKRVKKLQEETQKQGEKARDEYLKQQEKIFAEQRKAAEAEAKRQEERLRKLNTLGDQSIKVADIRNTESANLVLQLGANAQDPALIQARLQTKLLEKIAVGIGQASSNYFNQPVAIVGYADVGGI
jgi:hypothetical protein